jgi:isopenicillin N synthase-like dioxygenase
VRHTDRVSAPPLIALPPRGPGDALPPADLIDDVASACSDTGFFVVTRPDLEPAIDRAFTAAHELFALPELVKESLAMVDRQGFVPARHRALDHSLHSAPMEYYDVGMRATGGQRWPAQSTLPTFAHVVGEYQAVALDTAAELLRIVAIGLDLAPGFFAERMGAPDCFLRMMHYEPHPDVDSGRQVLTDPHTDYGLITLLATDGVGGLEIRDPDGVWSAVSAPPLSLIVNLGDMLARWTNDRYVSTPHRVSAPPGRDRYSVPFFVNPDSDTVVSCLASCIDPEHPCRYAAVTAGEFLAERIARGGYMDEATDS